MSAKTYRDYALELAPTVVAPGAENGERLSEFLGLMIDLLAEWDAQAVKAPLLLSNTTPTDALPLKGAERMSPRYTADTDATYRARLIDAWDRWAQAGTRQGITAEFDAFGVTSTLYSANGEWDWDGVTANWSRFWVVISDHDWTLDLWGATYPSGMPRTWGSHRTWGSDATIEEVRTMRAIVRRLKTTHLVCTHIIVVFDDVQWAADLPPDGTWDDPASRPDTYALYVDG